MAPSSTTLPEGHAILQYQVSGVLGIGGFGITYLAVDSTLQMQVAIKEYFPRDLVYRQDDGTVAEKLNIEGNEFQRSKETFIKEAQRIARFRNPGIVRVFNFFEANGTAYMVMEYEEGESLSAVLKRSGRLPESELTRVATAIIDALEVIHQAGFIHRDLKPDNIIMRRDGSPVLLDFGSTREFSGFSTSTMTAMVTPGFAPLEQYFDDGKRQGPWTDIYSLAAILHLSVSGSMPAQAPSRSSAVVNGQPDPLTRTAESCRAFYRRELLEAIDWGLELRESSRPQTLTEFKAALLGGAPASGPAEQPAAPSAAFAPQPTTTAGISSPAAMHATLRMRAGLAAAKSGGVTGGVTGGYGAPTQMSPAAPTTGAPTHRVGGAPPDDATRVVSAPPPATATTLVGGADATRVVTGMGEPTAVVAPPPAMADDGATRVVLSAASAPVLATALVSAPDGDPQAFAELDIPQLTERAEQGSPLAAFLLAARLQIDHPEQSAAAHKWLASAAEKGHAEAQYRLARNCAIGIGCEKDDAQAAHWYRAAAEQGIAEAQYEVALRYLGGKGVPKDAAAAARWFLAAADQEVVAAQVEAGLRYALGEGVEKNAATAVEWFRRAAAGGNGKGQYYLGFAYLKGLGVGVDVAQAKQWLETAARKDNGSAMRLLGEMYEKSLGVTFNLQEAYRWYYLARLNGDDKAAKRMGDLGRHMSAAHIRGAEQKARDWLAEL